MKQVNILENIKKKGTFQITPQDESLVLEASKQGFTEEQITKGIEAKKKLISTTPEVTGEETNPFTPPTDPYSQEKTEVISKKIPDIAWDQYLERAEKFNGKEFTPEEKRQLESQYEVDIVMPKRQSDPFGGFTKQELVQKAYMQGITSPTALKQIKEVYDIVKGTDENVDEFTTTEKRKLEQADLLKASRKEQLDFLYGE